MNYKYFFCFVFWCMVGIFYETFFYLWMVVPRERWVRLEFKWVVLIVASIGLSLAMAWLWIQSVGLTILG